MNAKAHTLFGWVAWQCIGSAAIGTGLAATLVFPALSADKDVASEAASESSDFDFGPLNAQIQKAVQLAKPACVAVAVRRNGAVRGTFSAVIVSSDGHVLTAGHAVQPGTEYEVTLVDGRKLKAKALGRSRFLDCGMIQIEDPTDLPWAEMGRSSELVRNQPCISISHPGGQNAKRGPVVRFGHVIDIHALGHIHNTCLMEPGDSGGGLFDLKGHVIGIHSYIHRNLSDNFDIPVDLFRDFWEPLCEEKEFNPPYAAPLFGIRLQSGRASEEGAEVTAVMKDSPAANAGLQAGDWITSLGKKEVGNKFPIGRELGQRMAKRGADLKLEIRRNDETQTIVIKTQLPKPPKIQDAPDEIYDTLANLAGGLSHMEDRLDDYTVRITSTVNNEERSLFGTVFSRDGLIVSKSSRVGEAPTVVDYLQRTLPARVIGRDEDNDLVLLQVDQPFEQAVEIDAAVECVEGTILVSPRPDERDGLVSVVGGKPFSSPHEKQVGFLGVMPGLQNNRVVLREIPDGPAKKAGLKPQDVVLEIDEKPITSVRELVDTIGSNPPGRKIRLLVQREDAEQVFEVVLTTRPRGPRRHIASEFAGGSSLRRTGFEAVFCHDAHAEPQECGGPVFDVDGNFIGVNIARFSRTHCYALPADLVRQSVQQLLDTTSDKETPSQDESPGS